MARAALLLVALAACRPPVVSNAEVELGVAPLSLDFGEVYVGGASSQAVTLASRGRAGFEVALSAGAPFAPSLETLRLSGGEGRPVEVTFRPIEAGAVTGDLTLEVEGARQHVALTGTGVPAPQCPARSECLGARFDAASGACVDEPIADGAACGAELLCLVGGECAAGKCVGTAPSCDDGNPCTADSCAPGLGCVHEDGTAQCPKGSACQVVTCDPASGCGLALASDGAPCGTATCITSLVCLSGACIEKPTPEGAACGEEEICRSRGQCESSVCVQPPVGAPRVAWRYVAPVDRSVGFVDVATPAGDVFFIEYGRGSLELVSLNRLGVLRFRRMVTRPGGLSLDLPRRRLLSVHGRFVEARSSDTGQLLWTTDVSVAVPVASPSSSGAPGMFTSPSSGPLVFADGTVVTLLREGVFNITEHPIALDGATGAVLWRAAFTNVSVSPGITPDGTLWLQRVWDASAQSEVVRIDRQGNRLNAAMMSGRVFAFTTDGALLSSSPDAGAAQVSSALTRTPLPTNIDVSDAITRADRLMLRQDDPPSLHAFDYPSLAPKWSAALPAGFHAFTAAKAGAVAMNTTELYGIDDDGQRTLECRLGFGFRQTFIVTSGRLYVNEGVALVAYELPGWEAATSGWFGEGGGLASDGRVH